MSDERDLAVKGYQRVITRRPVTFVCVECGQVVTEDRFPGPVPVVCVACLPGRRRRMKAESQRRRRLEKKEQTDN